MRAICASLWTPVAVAAATSLWEWYASSALNMTTWWATSLQNVWSFMFCDCNFRSTFQFPHVKQKKLPYVLPGHATRWTINTNGFPGYEKFIKIDNFIVFYNRSNNLSLKNTCSFPGFQDCSEVILCSDFRSQLLKSGTTCQELKVLSKIVTGVGDHFPGAEGAVKKWLLG